MQHFDSKQTGNNYGPATTLDGVWDSNGGYFVIQDADVYMQLQYGVYALSEDWTDEVHVPVGNGSLAPGTAGVKFRSYLSGVPATVTAGISSKVEPVFSIGSGGQVGSQVGISAVINGVTGTIISGSGFLFVKNGVGDYTVTFNSPYATQPAAFFETNANVRGTWQIYAGGPAAISFSFVDLAGALTDVAFNLFVTPTS